VSSINDFVIVALSYRTSFIIDGIIEQGMYHRRLCIKYITYTNCVFYSLLQTSMVGTGANIEHFLIINLCSIYSFKFIVI